MNAFTKRNILHMCFASIVSKSFTHPGSVGKAENGSTTRSMSRHLTNCISYSTKKNKIKASDFAARREAGQTILDDYDNDSMVDKVLKFFISGNVAFNQADNPYFQDLIRHAEAKVPGPKINRKSVRARLTRSWIGRQRRPHDYSDGE